MKQPFAYKKSLGQHFLNSDVVPTWLCDAGQITAGDIVLEIGPGTGALTKTLLARNATVIALETDARAITILEETFHNEISTAQLRLIKTDVRTLDLTTLSLTDHTFKVVANIPYYLSGYLFRSLMESPIQPNTLVFLVQKEVAKRAAAPLPPVKNAKGSLLALSLQCYGKVRVTRTVSRGHFTPPPNVDSAIVAITDISRDFFAPISETDFFTLIRLGFGQKRKQLFGILKDTYDPELLKNCFTTLDLPPALRAEDISLNTWRDITAFLHTDT